MRLKFSLLREWFVFNKLPATTNAKRPLLLFWYRDNLPLYDLLTCFQRRQTGNILHLPQTPVFCPCTVYVFREPGLSTRVNPISKRFRCKNAARTCWDDEVASSSRAEYCLQGGTGAAVICDDDTTRGREREKEFLPPIAAMMTQIKQRRDTLVAAAVVHQILFTTNNERWCVQYMHLTLRRPMDIKPSCKRLDAFHRQTLGGTQPINV